MDKVLCDISALRYYRTPPRYFQVLPRLPDFETPYGRTGLRENVLATRVLGLPIHGLELKGERLHSDLVRLHYWNGTLPSEAIKETPFDASVTSPLCTLLMLSTHISIVHLALLIYEFIGTFSVFDPDSEMQAWFLQAAGSDGDKLDDWRRVKGEGGDSGDLWSRPALLALDDIDECIEKCAGMRGVKNLALARRYVTGVTASPFEARASILLGTSRTLGGAGFTGLRNNYVIGLDADARRICGLSYVMGDLVWPEKAGRTPRDSRPLTILECQGSIVHGGAKRSAADDDRALALESMGIKVVRITYKQISGERTYELLVSHLARLLGIRQHPESQKMRDARTVLRKSLFVPWKDLGSQ